MGTCGYQPSANDTVEKVVMVDAAKGQAHTLSYFPFHGGRAAAIEIALYTAGVKYEFEGLSYADYLAKKESSKDTAWNNGMPVLTVGGKTFSQSLAMLRYAGKLGGLYPADPLEAMTVDEVMDCVQDIMTKCPQDKDEEVKKAKRQEYAAGKMNSLVETLAARATQAGSGYMVGSSLTVADLCVFFMVKGIRSGNFDHVDAAYTDKWPVLVTCEKKFLEDPKVAAFYAAYPDKKPK